MDTFFGRFKNIIVLAAILFAQVIGLAVQVKRASQEGDTRLIRVWAVGSVTPLEKGIVHAQHWVRGLWSNYLFLHSVRKENAELRRQIDQMKLDEVRLNEDAQMARRVQALLAFKEQYIDTTVAAQVIGTSGSEQSRILYIDKGSNDGIRTDMAVITPTGIVGKVVQVFGDSAQVLPINDQLSGVGAALKESRLQGILKGASNGATTLQYIMSDEKVTPGEEVITSGGDHIFPKGLPVGTVAQVDPGKDLFLNIRVIPAARLDQLEEVLVVTKMVEKPPDTKDLSPIRASDILAERLPSVPTKTPVDAAGNPIAPKGAAGANVAGTTNAATPAAGAPSGTARAAGAAASGTAAAGATKSLNGTSNSAGNGLGNAPGSASRNAVGTTATGATRTGAGTSATTGAAAAGAPRNPAGTSANTATTKAAINPAAKPATTAGTTSANGASAGTATQRAVNPAGTGKPATSVAAGATNPNGVAQPTSKPVAKQSPNSAGTTGTTPSKSAANGTTSPGQAKTTANGATGATTSNSAAKNTTGTATPNGASSGAASPASDAAGTTTRPAVVKRIVPPPGPDDPLNSPARKPTPAAKSTAPASQPAAPGDGPQPQP